MPLRPGCRARSRSSSTVRGSTVPVTSTSTRSNTRSSSSSLRLDLEFPDDAVDVAEARATRRGVAELQGAADLVVAARTAAVDLRGHRVAVDLELVGLERRRVALDVLRRDEVELTGLGRRERQPVRELDLQGERELVARLHRRGAVLGRRVVPD